MLWRGFRTSVSVRCAFARAAHARLCGPWRAAGAHTATRVPLVLPEDPLRAALHRRCAGARLLHRRPSLLSLLQTCARTELRAAKANHRGQLALSDHLRRLQLSRMALPCDRTDTLYQLFIQGENESCQTKRLEPPAKHQVGRLTLDYVRLIHVDRLPHIDGLGSLQRDDSFD